MKKKNHFITSNPITSFIAWKTYISLSKQGWLCLIKTSWCTIFMRVISSPSHYGPFGLQMGHLEDAFTLHPTVILQGPQAVCVNMIGVCVCVHACSGEIRRQAIPQQACICPYQPADRRRTCWLNIINHTYTPSVSWIYSKSFTPLWCKCSGFLTRVKTHTTGCKW